MERSNVFGMTFNFADDNELSRVIQAGVRWTRIGLSWSSIEPAPGERLWDENFDQELNRLTSLGVQSVTIIDGTPAWALKAGFTCGAVAESQFPLFGQFAYDLVKRYSQPPYSIHYWELWNEPDVAGILGCWGDPSDQKYFGGYYYGQMLKAVYSRIKTADPTAQVLVGGLLLDCDPDNPPVGKDCLPARFLEGILASGAGVDFDGVSFHAYDFYTGKDTYANQNWNSSSNTTGPVSIAKTRFLRSVLSNYGYGQKYLINTETAVFWGKNVMEPACDPNAPIDIEVTKVDYIVQSYAAAVGEGWKANIWYSALGVRCSGLLNGDMNPKPAYFAYKFAEQKLDGAVFLSSISGFPGVMGYEFQIPTGILWVVWALDGQTHMIDLPKMPIEVNRVGENGLAVGQAHDQTVTLQGSSLFIEFNP